MPPSSSADELIQFVRESISPASTGEPQAVPSSLSSDTAALTPSASLAQIATEHPSARRVSAIARPSPFVAPVTSALFPLSPKSIFFLLVLGTVEM